MNAPWQPGLLVLHGNRLEELAKASFAWLAAHPLAPLEEEILLVQSNGMAEWLKMALAAAQGICAATRVELPARFIWRAYRSVLGRAAVPAVSALDKLPLTWRLMGLLPALASTPGFEPVAGFLGRGGDAARRLQLAERLADLYDQYQVYRSDWLDDWAQGRDQLRPPQGAPAALPDDQRWQPALWRALLAGLSPFEQQATRALLHQRFVQALQSPQRPPGLPRRVVLFGTTHIPHQTLEAIAALAAHTQVLMAVPNPCRYHWADLIDGRELLRAAQRRHPLRQGRDLAAVALHDLHAHGHPLLAAWGRQSRDFVRQLDAYDDVQLAQARFAVPRVDLFDEGPGGNLLEQVQARIRDLEPLADPLGGPPAEAAAAALPAADRSVVFHIAHSAQREVEILHDQLLQLLAQAPPERPLNPRDIVVMVPDIDAYAAAIRSVFGQHPRTHPRHIPWGLADQSARGHQPLLVALEWLLKAPQQRHSFSELRGLLEVPALARRFGLAVEDLPTLVDWIEGAGVRWGLHAAQRARLGLDACGEANTWRFGLRRMLLGYATGALQGGHAGIEPYAEIAGLSAGLAGTLAELLATLDGWWTEAATPCAPAAWGLRLRALLAACFTASDDNERAALAALDEALAAWLQACETAGYDEAVELPVVREAWLAALDAPGVSRRFKAGGVTFCTLLPLRAIPFDVVCLLGMNDGDYPRRGARSDFDLMAQPGQARPGDRSRRDDDRQLMLDALLSARRVLYVSWAGRSPRDNQLQPPSVLVAQLRDYLQAGWGAAALAARTTEHPLQPFSRRYFEVEAKAAGRDGAGNEAADTAADKTADTAAETATEGTGAAPGAAGLFTYAAEWRTAHDGADAAAGQGGAAAASAAAPTPPAATPAAPAARPALTLADLGRFLRNPVQAYFRHRLQVRFDEREAAAQDDERFVTAGLDRWQLLDEVLAALRRPPLAGGAFAAPGAAGWARQAPPLSVQVDAQLARLQRAGRLPLAGPGARVQAELAALLSPMLAHWQTLQAQHPQALDKRPLRLADPERPGLRLDDWLLGLQSSGEAGATPQCIELQASALANAKRTQARPDKLLRAWVRGLAAAACGEPVGGVLIGSDAVLHLAPAEPEAARATLRDLLRACDEGLTGTHPLPTAVRTGLAWLDAPERAAAVFEGSRHGARGAHGEGREACLARLYADWPALRDDPGFAPATQRLYAPYRQWLAEQVRIEDLPGHAEIDGDGDA